MSSPGLEYMPEDMSWLCTLKQAFQGAADCTQILWTLFDMSIPEWSLLFFVGMMILGLFQLLHLLRSTYRMAAR
jgi:disulfide bond formation protein DsbB